MRMRSSWLAARVGLLVIGWQAARADVFVSPAGSDANPGSKNMPFATLERARDALRESKRAGKIPKRGLTVWLRGGDYIRTNAFELSSVDSGLPAAPITWRAYRDERVRLLGGRGLTGFQPVTDRAAVWRGMVDDYMRRQLAGVPSALYRKRYPELCSLDGAYGPPGGPPITGAAFQGVPPANNLIARNVCVGKWLDLGWHAQADMFDVRDNFVTADTNQVAVGGAFRLSRNSPAWKFGFQRIPFEEIGPRPDADRTRLARQQ
jgi:hypothetical protein